MKVAIIDAQGAGLGQAVIKKLRKETKEIVYIVALGTNTAAAANMVRAGANEAVIGEENIREFLKHEKIQSIVGPIGIMCSGGINGEITDKLSREIFRTDCIKYIIPIQRHGIYVPGTKHLQIKDIIEEIVLDIKSNMNGMLNEE